MSYVRGSDSETMTFTDDGIAYQPGGLAHAVDTDSPISAPQALLAYAVCGTPVRLWPEQPFDPSAPGVHDQCAALTRRD